MKNSVNSILEGLSSSRICEGFDKKVSSEFKSFMGKMQASSDEIKDVSKVLNDIYLICNDITDGGNDLSNPRDEFKSLGTYGDSTDKGYGEYEFKYDVDFNNKVYTKDLIQTVIVKLKEKKYKFKSTDARVEIDVEGYTVFIQITPRNRFIVGVKVIADGE